MLLFNQTLPQDGHIALVFLVIIQIVQLVSNKFNAITSIISIITGIVWYYLLNKTNLLRPLAHLWHRFRLYMKVLIILASLCLSYYSKIFRILFGSFFSAKAIREILYPKSSCSIKIIVEEAKERTKEVVDRDMQNHDFLTQQIATARHALFVQVILLISKVFLK